MSPERPSSRRAGPNTPISKPYVRNSSNNLEKTDLTAQTDIAQVNSTTSKPGFPSYTQYRTIEANYLKSILPKRQCRALISQALFDRIWHILQDPNSMAEDAQFRYWVRKMFALGTLNDLNVGVDVLDSQMPQAVMLHDGRMVAVREQIYDILCYAHGGAKHGGRDKTFASVRKHYSWIPKELVAQFIKACPSCLMKKCGLSRDIQDEPTANGGESALPTLRDFLRNLGRGTTAEPPTLDQHVSTAETRSIPGPSTSTNPVFDHPIEQIPSQDAGAAQLQPKIDNFLNRYLSKSEPYEILMNPTFGPELLRRAKTELQSLPMSREISLYQGLPNGWQYHTDYETAHAEFVQRRGNPGPPSSFARERRPRVPSIVPMRNVLSESEAGAHRGPLSLLEERGASPRASRADVPLALTPGPTFYIPQIDPALFAVEDPGQDSLTTATGSHRHSPNEASAECPNPHLRTATSIRRSAIPLPINLQSLTSQNAIEAFLAHRAAEGVSPDSPTVYSTASPTSSAGSYSSRLSAFPMTATSSVSPANSVLPTPVDEATHFKEDNLGKELANTARGIHLNPSVEAVCDGDA